MVFINITTLKVVNQVVALRVISTNYPSLYRHFFVGQNWTSVGSALPCLVELAGCFRGRSLEIRPVNSQLLRALALIAPMS